MGDSYRPDHGHHAHPSGGGGYDRRPSPPSYGHQNYRSSRDDHYSYRPGTSNNRGGDHYAPHHPLPPRPGPGDMLDFGQPQQFANSDFSFRADNRSQLYPPPPPGTTGFRRHDNDPAQRRKEKGKGRNNNQGRNRPYQKPGASDRKLLQTMPRERTPPLLEGMNEGNAGVRYAELLSSDDEEVEADPQPEGAQPQQPKWSNPEMYTALPPPDEGQRKRKDMVKLIRKSRLEASDANGKSANAIATNDDFISLNFGGEDEEELIKPGTEGAPEGPAAKKIKSGPPGAPKGPAAEQIKPGPPYAPKGPAGEKINGSFTIKGIAGNASLPASGSPNTSFAQVDAIIAETVGMKLNSLKRKRADDEEADDLELRNLQPPNKSLKRPPTPTGHILREWAFQGSNSHLAVPWLRPTGKYKIAAATRLHQELVDFCEFVGPRKYEDTVRQNLLKRLRHFINQIYPGAEVHIFGSYAAGLYLPDADMDVSVLSPEYRRNGIPMIRQSWTQLNKLANNLMQSGFAESTEVIPSAKVPIVKFVDRLTSLKVDMSFENETGLIANETFQRWKTEYPAMPLIVMVIKQFLLMRGLNDVSVGGIGGFSVTCLVTSLLQNMPRVQTGELDPLKNLGELLIEFLDFYGNRINYERVGLRMDPPGYVRKDDMRRSGQIQKFTPERLMIIDPNLPTNDISGGSRHAWMIFDEFATAKNSIVDAMETYNRTSDSSRFSLLGCVLGGNYDSFLWYRRHLRRIHEEQFGRDDKQA